MRELQEHGLTAVFFVEPLFSTRFGLEPLAEIIGLVREREHEVQLHLHTEWVDEYRQPLLDGVVGKKQFLHYFSLEEQTSLIRTGANLIESARGQKLNAFSQEDFGFNRDSRRLARNRIAFDSSYNASMFGAECDVIPEVVLVEPAECDGVYNIP